jgi:integrase
MSDFYNEAIKNRYLDEITNEGSRNTIKYVFLASKRTEEIKGMDLYNFSKEDIALVLKDIPMISFHTVRANFSYINSYITWCIKNGYRENNLNPLDTVDRKWLSQFYDKTLKIHYSYDEFIDLLEDDILQNSIDKSLLMLMFHGIIGEQFSQIKSLQFSDIDFNNKTIYVKERNYHVPVDEKTIEYLQKARNEKTYYQFNSGNKEFTEKVLLESQYVFKTIQSPRGEANAPIKTNVIYKRLHSFKELFESEYLTPNAIKQSGMIKMAADLFLRDGIIGYDQLAEIGEKYDYSTILNQSNGEPYYNTHLMKIFITESVIKDLYNIDAEIKIR